MDSLHKFFLLNNILRNSTVDIVGFGVFTTKEFKRGDFLLEYAGELIDNKAGKNEKWNIRMKMLVLLCTILKLVNRVFGKPHY